VAEGGQIPVPLRNRNGVTIAYAVLDVEDAHLAEYRWYLDSDPGRRLEKLYARRNVDVGDGKRRGSYLHREVLGLAPGDRRQVDHENGLTLDCRRANLRIATHSENGQNRRNLRSATLSRHRGVTWNKQKRKWVAHATLGGKYRFLGYFADEDEAGRVAADWRREHMPFSSEASSPGEVPARGGTA
jgi:hypothetical protein